jgi:hypothetical protein
MTKKKLLKDVKHISSHLHRLSMTMQFGVGMHDERPAREYVELVEHAHSFILTLWKKIEDDQPTHRRVQDD